MFSTSNIERCLFKIFTTHDQTGPETGSARTRECVAFQIFCKPSMVNWSYGSCMPYQASQNALPKDSGCNSVAHAGAWGCQWACHPFPGELDRLLEVQTWLSENWQEHYWSKLKLWTFFFPLSRFVIYRRELDHSAAGRSRSTSLFNFSFLWMWL